MTAVLTNLRLPLPGQFPPPGFEYDRNDVSTTASDSTAFNTGIDQRDQFRDEPRCIVCGFYIGLEHCHLIPHVEKSTWLQLKHRQYVPSSSKQSPEHEPRNGVLMCRNHHYAFDHFMFFIRFHQPTRKYYLINYSGSSSLAIHDGRAVALDFAHYRAPYPAVFLIHEIRARGFWPFRDEVISIVEDQYQHWVVEDGFVGPDGYLKNDLPSPPPSSSQPPQSSSTAPTSILPGASDFYGSLNTGLSLQAGRPLGRVLMLPPPRAIESELVAYSKTMPTWRAAIQENESWSGTASENIDKYLRVVQNSGLS